MIKREIGQKCLALSKKFPVVTITGPRQSGKTTLAKTIFPNKPYVNLEQPDSRRLALDDPKAFLKNYPNGAILDEIQRTPEIPSYIQAIVDETAKKGLFVLTGSQQFEIVNSVSQSLAGRTAVIKLLPLSLSELNTNKKHNDLNRILIDGFYPRLHNEGIKPLDFYMSYFETYIQRDLRQISQIDNLHTFDKFVRLLAGRTGQLLNYNSLSNDLGVSQPTIKKWVSILEASYIIFLLQPFSRNIGKRLIKTPKVYFTDVGLASYLLGIESISQVKIHPLRGHLFENFVIAEFLKSRFNQAKLSNLFFYRDRTGNEVDLIIENGQDLVPVEIKSAETISSDFAKGIKNFKEMFGKQVKNCAVVYCGEKEFSMNDISYFSWKNLPLKLNML